MTTPLNERRIANAIRVLAMDAVQQANSGHPGAPMGMADIADVVWREFLNHNPTNPQWANRDRFVLSNGHGSMLQYALLHLTGYDLSIEDLKQFRQLHSKTPGHPEYGYAPGIETTTGPLGQGIANAVGFALAEKTLAAQFNKDGLNVVDHFTYCFLGDGCLMEGISHEVCSLAGTLGLGKLIAYYDDNGISIDGEVEGWFSDDTEQRFKAYGWQVLRVDGHDADAIRQATVEAKAESNKPTIIICKTIIGLGSPNKQGKEDCHGAPLGKDEIALTREALGWKEEAFVIPEDVYASWDAKAKGQTSEAAWNELFAQYQAKYPTEAAELLRRINGDLPAEFAAQADAFIAETNAKAETIATRKASQNTLQAFGPLLPELLGGSADLAGSNLTLWKGCQGVQDNPAGNYVYYGVREFGMTAIANGVALHGDFVPYVATFLMFMEYARNAVRMSALMKQRVIHVYTHDSIGLGEDGPTHQPIETMTSLRAIPGVQAIRPGDPEESMEAWKIAYASKDHPVCMAFTRQALPVYAKDDKAWKKNMASCGAYIVKNGADKPDITILASGSEVNMALQAAEMVPEKKIRVVSVPDLKKFEGLTKAKQDAIIGDTKRVVCTEAGISMEWLQFTSKENCFCIDTFGTSGPANKVAEYLGFTAKNLAKLLKK
ncbi:MAG: transketolase [Acinetobacter sp.]|nr:transketolase [Acinetobacter sp.]